MKKTLVKSKIVLEDNGKSLIVYFWKKTFLCFGYWYPFGCSSSISKISDEKINRINDNTVSELFYENYLKGFK
jgi:hypothetical protein